LLVFLFIIDYIAQIPLKISGNFGSSYYLALDRFKKHWNVAMVELKRILDKEG